MSLLNVLAIQLTITQITQLGPFHLRLVQTIRCAAVCHKPQGLPDFVHLHCNATMLHEIACVSAVHASDCAFWLIAIQIAQLGPVHVRLMQTIRCAVACH